MMQPFVTGPIVPIDDFIKQEVLSSGFDRMRVCIIKNFARRILLPQNLVSLVY